MCKITKFLQYKDKYLSENWDESLQLSFNKLVNDEDDLELLDQALRECYSYTDLSIPILERMLALSPKNVSYLIAIATLFWSIHEDAISRKYIEIAKCIEPLNPEISQLELGLED